MSWKRLVAALIAAFLVVQSCPIELLWAQEQQEPGPAVSESVEDTTEDMEEATKLLDGATTVTEQKQAEPEEAVTEQKQAEPEEAVTEQKKSEPEKVVTEKKQADPCKLNYVTISASRVNANETQQIVASLGTEQMVPAQATLSLTNETTKEVLKLQSKKTQGNAFYFELIHKETKASVYKLEAVSYTYMGQDTTLCFETLGMKIRYGVNTDVNTSPDAYAMDANSTQLTEKDLLQVATMDANGNPVDGETIAKAIDQAESVVGTDGLELNRAKKTITIMLDPGHDNVHCGARGNGLCEEMLNLKIALACKTELEKYKGVTIYMTRPGVDCPNPGTTSGVCNEQRVAYAKRVKADYYISIHNNAGSAVASGSEVYYPNASYQPTFSTNGKALAEKVLTELQKLGLTKRGAFIRDCTDNGRYPDGNLEDYYGVIRNSKYSGICGIIIEHAFVSNPYDAQTFLTTDAQLTKLGVADAKAIAKNFKLAARSDLKPESVKLEANVDSAQTKCKVTITGMEQESGAKLYVYNTTQGSEKGKWYSCKQDSTGKWSKSIAISDFAMAGSYVADLYVVRSDKTEYKLKSTGFRVAGPTADSIKGGNVNALKGTFKVTISGIKTASKIKSMKVAVWSKKDQSNLHWYKATASSDGKKYYIKANIAKNKYKYGTYKCHVYVTLENGIEAVLGSTSVKLDKPKQETQVNLNKSQTKAYITVKNGIYYKDQKLIEVKTAVWSEKKGQDDLKWYKGKADGDGVWKSTVKISKHKTSGKYQAHTYGVTANGKTVMLSDTSFTIGKPTAKEIKASKVNEREGKLKLSILGVSSAAGVEKAELQVWSEKDQSNLHTYKAKLSKSGSYEATVKLTNHACRYGSYQVKAYVTDKNGIKVKVLSSSFTINKPSQETNATIAKDGRTVELGVLTSAIYKNSLIQEIKCAVWSEKNDQDDLVWYPATKNSVSQWSALVKLSNHKTEGSYKVETYAVLQNGKTYKLSKTSFTVTGPSAKSLQITNKKEAEGLFDVELAGATSGCAISKVQVAIWCDSDKNDLVWYDAQKDGKLYRVSADVQKHKAHLGKYNAHVYVTDKNGICQVVGKTTVSMVAVTNGLYSIMGSNTISTNMLMKYYQANATYPEFYKDSDAPTLKDFCQMYIDECKAEGVKPEVAFCQSMKETGFLRFGGMVQINQFNFAGIGAVDSGETAPNTFASVREGIRAQVQHLKAYASTQALKNPCVDPRYQFVRKGSTPYVEWLGQHENPNGYGWATAIGYGNSLRNDYIAKLMVYDK